MNRRRIPDISKRDWFAGMALAGIGTWAPNQPKDHKEWHSEGWYQNHACEVRAEYAYKMADAMIAESERT